MLLQILFDHLSEVEKLYRLYQPVQQDKVVEPTEEQANFRDQIWFGTSFRIHLETSLLRKSRPGAFPTEGRAAPPEAPSGCSFNLITRCQDLAIWDARNGSSRPHPMPTEGGRLAGETLLQAQLDADGEVPVPLGRACFTVQEQAQRLVELVDPT